jgi:hypothetical protein
MKRSFANNNLMCQWIGKLMFSAVCVLVLSTCTFAKLNVVFRYDDLSGDLPGSRTTGSRHGQVWRAEKDVFNRFAGHGFHYVVSVIPQPIADHGLREHAVAFYRDEEKVDYFAAAEATGVAEIALHGYSHVNHATKGHRPGEFRERTYLDQYNDIQAGLDILKVCGFNNVITFVPPWHGWDSNTARALIDSDFRILSTRSYYYTQLAESLCLIPKTISLEALELEFENASLPQDGLIVVLFHPYDLVSENGGGCFGSERLKQILERLSQKDDVHVVSFRDLYGEDAAPFSFRRYKALTWAKDMREFSATFLPKKISSYDLEASLPATASTYKTEYQSYLSASVYFILSVALLCLVALLTLAVSRRILRNKQDPSTRIRLIVKLACFLVIVCSVYQEYDLINKGYIPVSAWFFPATIALVVLGACGRRPKRVFSKNGRVDKGTEMSTAWVPDLACRRTLKPLARREH